MTAPSVGRGSFATSTSMSYSELLTVSCSFMSLPVSCRCPSHVIVVSCRPSSWYLGQWARPVAVSVELGVLLLGGGQPGGGPSAAAAQVDLFDGGAFAPVGRAGGGDGQQDLFCLLYT